jgi:hypothetical protein
MADPPPLRAVRQAIRLPSYTYLYPANPAGASQRELSAAERSCAANRCAGGSAATGSERKPAPGRDATPQSAATPAVHGPGEPQMGANAISRPPTQPDPARMFIQVKGSPLDSVRRQQTPKTALDFPDTEEATSSNLVPPTTPHSARADGDGWSLTWLPGRILTRQPGNHGHVAGRDGSSRHR